MFSVFKGEIKYFDESGDTGDVKSKSNTNFFDIALYVEKDSNDTVVLIQKIRQEFNLKDYQILKWNKLSWENKVKFKNFCNGNLSEITYFIWSDKKNIDIFGEDLYRNMLYKLIKENNLYGRFNYDGDHMFNLVSKVKRLLKTFGVKSFFENLETQENFGIQIADLCAGYLNWCLENKIDTKFKNIIKF